MEREKVIHRKSDKGDRIEHRKMGWERNKAVDGGIDEGGRGVTCVRKMKNDVNTTYNHDHFW